MGPANKNESSHPPRAVVGALVVVTAALLLSTNICRATPDAVRRLPPSTSESSSSRALNVHYLCKQLYEYSNFMGTMNNVTYTGSQHPEPNLGQFDSPVFDNPNLQGSPVARLRGTYLEDVVATYATFVSAFELYGSTNDYLVISLGFSTATISNGTGVALGGTGLWTEYRGSVTSEPFNASWTNDNGGARPLVFRYTICR